MGDSEVNEMRLYEDVNVFELTRSGSLVGKFCLGSCDKSVSCGESPPSVERHCHIPRKDNPAVSDPHPAKLFFSLGCELA